ncbi:MAG: hypothetical protein LBT00_04015 [Spirochaetaceae bacterium]|nr:hypothetical protein [Spirochaetaceae bacterium]
MDDGRSLWIASPALTSSGLAMTDDLLTMTIGRHCETRSGETIQTGRSLWIASPALTSGSQ